MASWLNSIEAIKKAVAGEKYATCLVGAGVETVSVTPPRN